MKRNAPAENPALPPSVTRSWRAAWRPFGVMGAAGVAGLLGLSVAAGWAFDIPTLRSVIPGAVEMKANTAAGLIAMAVAALLCRTPLTARKRWLVAGLSALVLLLGSATLSQYLFGWQLGIDEFLVRDTGAAFNQIKGRMSPYSTLALCALGLAGLAQARWRGGLPVKMPAGVAIAIAILSLVGYLWNAVEIVTDQVIPPVAVNTAVGFFLLGSAFLIVGSQAPAETPPAARNRLEKLLLSGMIPTLMAVLVGGGLTYQSGARYAWAADRVAHTQEVRAVLGMLYAAISDAEAAQAKVILLDAERHDIDFRAEAEAARTLAATLGKLLTDNPDQAERHVRLEALMNARLDSLAAITRLYRNEGQESARRGYLDGIRAGGNAQLRTMILQMDLSEERLLRSRLDRVREQRNSTLVSLLVTLALVCAVSLMLFGAVRHEVVARSQAEAELQALNASLEQRIARRTQELSFQRAFLQRVLDLNRSFIYATDGEGRFVLANPALVEALGSTSERVLGRHARDVHPAARQLVVGDRQVIHSGEERVIAQEAFTDASGRARWLFTVKRPILSPDGRSTIVLGVSIDITERKAAEDAARQLAAGLERRVEARTLDLYETTLQLEHARRDADAASRAKSAFLANMSHEIRTPMNAIIGLTHLVRREAADPVQRERLDEVNIAAKHLLQLISDILDMSKIEAGKLVLNDTTFSLDELLADTTRMVAARAQEKGLDLSVDSGQAPHRLVGDAMRLSQVLLNLLSNAVKFTEKGFVRLRAAAHEQEGGKLLMRFEVEDSGPGIAEALQAKLFMPFEQGDPSVARQHGGTGLGLALSRELARAMGGDAGVHSTPGAGSCFWFTARLALAPEASGSEPLTLPAEHQAADGSEALLRSRHQGRRVLLAEDNPINRKVAKTLLEAAGLMVETADDGARALELAAQRPYDLVLMDVQMPVMDGLQAARAIRLKLGKGLTIIAMTANAFAEDRQACLDSGMDDHLVKPVDPQQLYATLLRWLPSG